MAAIEITAAGLRGDARRRRRERAVRLAFAAAALVSLAISAAIVAALIGRALGFLLHVDAGQLVAGAWSPRRQQFDLPTIFLGSVIVTLIAMAVAAPLGLGAATYLAEYARPRVRRVLKPVVETLASIPSVVMGYFALTVVNPTLVRPLFAEAPTFTLMAAGIGVGLLTVPLVASVAEDALFAVPGALREAAAGLGARRRTITMRVVFPAAVSGVVAALILGVSRALGETMVVAIAAGGTGNATRTIDPLGPGQTMTGAIASLAYGSDTARGQEFGALFLVGLLLFVFTLSLNVASERLVRRVWRTR